MSVLPVLFIVGLCEHRDHASYLAIPSMISPSDGYACNFAVDLLATDY